MIIGEAFKEMFNGLEIETFFYDKQGVKQSQMQTLKCHYGDHKELIKWSLNAEAKYPLLWYVTAPYFPEDNTDYKRCRSKFVILFSFRDMVQYDWFNDVKSKKTYNAVIEPVWDEVKKVLKSNPGALQVLGSANNKYVIKDEPNYGVKTDGVRTSQTDFTAKTENGTESITIDWVDGRIIELEFRINTKCI